jgi:hypothetical protein
VATAEDAVSDTVATVAKAAEDVESTVAKAGRDSEAEIGRAGRNLEDAGQAIGRFIERQAHGVGDSLSNAERRVREGKVVDALWHLGTEPLQSTEDNAARLAQESTIIATVAQVAASAYGGPGGAAAYAAWFTYKQTGDPEMALRVGLITGATASGFAEINAMPVDSAGDLAKKTILAGAVGGLAVAASGGDEAAVEQAFVMAGAMVLVQDGYKRVTQHDLDARAAEGEAYCMASVGADCSPPDEAFVRDADGKVVYEGGQPKVDMSKVPPRVPHVGEMRTAGQTPTWNQEGSVVMNAVAKVPGMNAMALFHDQWAISWNMDALTLRATIAPAVMLTYVGTAAPVYDLIQKTNVEGTAESESSSDPVLQRATFLCANGDVSRTIVVEATKQSPPPLCRTVYTKESGSTQPWTANNDQQYCVQHAAELAMKLQSNGWSCFVQ